MVRSNGGGAATGGGAGTGSCGGGLAANGADSGGGGDGTGGAEGTSGSGGGGGWRGCCERMRAGYKEHQENRLLRLIWWDTGSFALASLVFCGMAVRVAVDIAQLSALAAADAFAADALANVTAATTFATSANATFAPSTAAAATTDGLSSWLTPLLVSVLPMDALMLMGDPRLWADWRMQVSFHLARILFALSALPFVLFVVPGLQTLLSHTRSTGYNRRGECVAYDSCDAASYTAWLMRELESAETIRHFDGDTRKELLEKARNIADKWREFPHREGKLWLKRECGDLQMHLAAVVPKDHPLYRRFFAEQLLLDEYTAHVINNEKREQ